jgi:hypothetical protein
MQAIDKIGNNHGQREYSDSYKGKYGFHLGVK